MVDDDLIKNENKRKIKEKRSSSIFAVGIMTSIFILFAFVYLNSVLNNRIEGAPPGNSTNTTSTNGTAIKKTISNETAAATNKEKSANNTKNENSTTSKTTSTTNTNTHSSAGTPRPNSNMSRLARLTTTQGNITTNANAPGSPFPPKEANSTSYFPTTNKVAIVVGAALLRDKAYQPNPVNVRTGGVVTWTNEDTVVHTVTSGTGLTDPHLGNQFDSGLLGGHFSHIFFKAGVFPYFCEIHPTMVGEVIVK
jgi:plastocyanin